MIHVKIGDGVGKTTSAIGLAVRAAGHNLPVLFMQFLKDDSSGEVSILKSIPGITVCHAPVNYGFTFQMTDEQLKETAAEYEKMLEAAMSSDAFMIILDEVIHALNAGLVKEEQLRTLLEKDAEIVLTGWNAPDWLLEKADYVSIVHKRKHPYDRGIEAGLA